MTPTEVLDDLRNKLIQADLRQVALRSGLSTKTLRRIRDKLHSPTIETLQRLSEALRDAPELIDAEGAPPVPKKGKTR